MNKFAKAAMWAAAGILLGSQGARAAYVANDLVLGFDRIDNGGSGPQPQDYVIDLGNASSVVGVGGTSVVDLSSHVNFSTFTSLYGSLASGVSMSVVGGNPISGSSRDIFATQLRGSLGTPGVAGSSAPATITSSAEGAGANDVKSLVNNLGLSAGNGTTIAQNDPNSFNTWVVSSSPPSFAADTGIDARGTTTGSVLYEDLYKAQAGGAFSYLGYFTLDMSGPPSLTFTPAALAVPEPATGGILAVGGLLLLSLRRQLKRGQA